MTELENVDVEKVEEDVKTLNISLLDHKGKVVESVDADGVKEEIILLDLVLSALNNVQLEKDTLKKKARRFKIAIKLATNDGVIDDTFTNKDKVMIMETLGKESTPIIVGRVAEIMDKALLQDEDE